MAKELDFDAIKAAAESHRADMTRFLRAMISHPSESCEEGEVVACIKAEMESLGYDEVKVDGLGNVMGFMGEGDKIIAIDSHIDTSASATSRTGMPIPMRATRPTRSSTAAAALTRRAAWLPLPTLPR